MDIFSNNPFYILILHLYIHICIYMVILFRQRNPLNSVLCIAFGKSSVIHVPTIFQCVAIPIRLSYDISSSSF